MIAQIRLKTYIFPIFQSYPYFEFLPWQHILDLKFFLYMNKEINIHIDYQDVGNFSSAQTESQFESFLFDIGYLRELQQIIDFWTGSSES